MLFANLNKLIIRRCLPICLLLAVGTLWGLFYSLIKQAVLGGVHPVNYVFWFTFISGSLLIFGCLLRGIRLLVAKEHLGYYLRIGLIRFSIANLFFYAAQGNLPVGVAAVVMAFTPIFTYAISLILRIDPFSPLRVIGIFLGFAGVMLIVLPRSSLPDPSMIFYVFLCFCAPFLHALGYVLLSEKSRPQNADSMMIAGGTLVAASVISFFIAVIWGEWALIVPPFGIPQVAMLTHAALAALNFYMIFELIRISGPTYMSQSSNLALGFGVLFGWLIFDEVPSVWIWGAIFLIVAGVAFVNSQSEKNKAT
jgi:drug/metabolite transporter (DMT)-like permease